MLQGTSESESDSGRLKRRMKERVSVITHNGERTSERGWASLDDDKTKGSVRSGRMGGGDIQGRSKHEKGRTGRTEEKTSANKVPKPGQFSKKATERED